LNTQNVHAIPDTLEFIERELPGRRVCFFFHTPYYGIDDLFLDRPSRLQAAETIVREKRNGRPVLNSVAGIRAIARGTFRHPLPYTVVVDATGEYRCCRAVRTPEVCAHCGYATCAEMELVRHLHPSALREALRYAF
jgi:hypothetical protein